MPKPRKLASALVVLLVVALAPPAWSAAPSNTPEEQRDAAREKKAAIAAEVDTLKASNDDLETAVRDLDAGVQVQSNQTESAKRALQSAETGLGSAESKLAATEERMAGLRQQVAVAAVRAYVHPGGEPLLEIVRSKDLGEASRRQVLLSSVVSSDRDALDQMRAARQDQQFDKANLAKARDLAQDRRKAAAEHLAELQEALNQQNRLKGALDTRIAEYTAEVDALTREEATLSALIRSRQAAAAAEAEAEAEAEVEAGAEAGADEEAVSDSGMVWPASGPVTSGFGMRWGRLHSGIDIGAGYGASIRAAQGGTVILAGYNGGYGNCVVIDHGGGLSTLYGHMSSVQASEGEAVDAGDGIGEVGSTGNSTGPHLHFETRIDGSAENPMRYLP
ncbi:MAG TPA: peptidoglycan DD-metalloendopeptidase family protein [Acidimicrobiales bacterium]|nr:peptidoglycan DD-metalloendopeptidase family protein [Acidimicrobiales bacterium]